MTPYNFCNNSPIIFIDPNGKEAIIIVGGYDKGHEGADARKFINSAFGHAKNSTIVLMTANMTKEEIVEVNNAVRMFNYNSIGTANHVNLVIANNTDEMVNYLNSKSTINSDVTDERKNDKVTNVTLYGHGLAGNISLTYPNVGGNCDLIPSDVQGMSPEAFDDNATIDLYNCNTATDVPNGTNMAKHISSQTQTKVTGYEGKTDYKDIYGYYERACKKLLGSKIVPASNQPAAAKKVMVKQNQ
jgi:hypothetical protein